MRARRTVTLLISALVIGAGLIAAAIPAIGRATSVPAVTPVGPPLDGLALRITGGTDGYDPFTCPADAPPGCGAQLAPANMGHYQVGFEVPSGDGLHAGDTLTFTAPNGVKFPADLGEYEIGWGGTTDDNVEPSIGGPANDENINVGCFDNLEQWRMTPTYQEPVDPSTGEYLEDSLYTVPNEGCQDEARPAAVVENGNTVTVTLPAGFHETTSDASNGWPAVLDIDEVDNPPAGTYQPNQFVLSASSGDTSSDYSPGPIANSPEFDYSSTASQANTLLTVSSSTIPVSNNSGVEVTGTVRDEYGNPIPGATVGIEPLSGNATPIDNGSTSTTTGDDGTVSQQFADTVAQTVDFDGYVTDPGGNSFSIQQTPSVTFTPGPPVAANSSVQLGNCVANCDADAQASAVGGQIVLRAYLRDQYDNDDIGDQLLPVPSGLGEFKKGTVSANADSQCPTGGSTPVLQGVGCVNSDGYADFTVSDPVAEDVPFTLDDLTNGTTLTLTPEGTDQGPLSLDFVAGPPATTSIAATSNTATADGHSSDTITVSLVDANGNPVSGLSIALAAGPGSDATITGSATTTNSGGTAQLTVTDTAVQTVNFTATYSGTIGGAPVSGAVSGSAAVAFLAGPTSSTLSTLSASPADALDNGTQSSTVTATLEDAEGHPAAGRAVTLAGSADTASEITAVQIPDATSGCPTQAPAGSTDCNGQTQFRVTDTAPETVIYTATDQSTGTIVDQTAEVTFTAPPAASTSTVAASPRSLPADGTSTSSVLVTLEDADGNPVVGRQVCLTQTTAALAVDDCATESATTPSTITAASDPGSACLGAPPSPGTTNCAGQALFTVSATSPGPVTYGVIDVTDDGPDGALIGPAATVTFARVQSEAGQSSITASPAEALAATAGPTGSATVTVQLVSASGAALPGDQVSLAASSPTATVTPVASPATGCGSVPPAGTTDCNGVATFSVSDAAPESVTFTATDASTATSILQTALVSFLSNEATTATVSTSSANVPANGGLTSAGVALITVSLDPGEPATNAGDLVSISQTSGTAARIVPQSSGVGAAGCPTAPAAGVANCHGTVSFAVSDVNPETATFAAIDHTSGVALGQTTTVTFTAIGPMIESISPAAGPLAGGTAIAISGLGLMYGPHAPQILIGSRPARDVTCVSTTSCSVIVPPGIKPGAVRVEINTALGSTGTAAQSANQFSYLVGKPVISKVTPRSGPVTGGTIVTITGRNLEEATAVTFGRTRVVVRSVNAAGTKLTVRAPSALKGLEEVRVTTPAGISAQSKLTHFTYRPVVVPKKTTKAKPKPKATTRKRAPRA